MGEFPTDYQRWRRKAVREGYPRCTNCGEPVQKEYQKKGTHCRQCTERKAGRAPQISERFPDGGTDAVRYEQGPRYGQ